MHLIFAQHLLHHKMQNCCKDIDGLIDLVKISALCSIFCPVCPCNGIEALAFKIFVNSLMLKLHLFTKTIHKNFDFLPQSTLLLPISGGFFTKFHRLSLLKTTFQSLSALKQNDIAGTQKVRGGKIPRWHFVIFKHLSSSPGLKSLASKG